MDLSALIGMLVDRIDALARELAPDGVRRGPEWVARNPVRADRHLGSFSICVSGARAGVWADFAEKAGGDALDLVAYCRCGGDKGAAVRWARSWLGVDASDPAAFERRSAEALARSAARKAEAAKERAKVNARAQALWLAGQARLAGTPVEAYLLARGIDLRLLGRQPAALRFVADCLHGPLQRRFPAMVAMIVGPGDDDRARTMGVHRTFLIERAGTWTHVGKAGLVQADGALADGKLVLGDKKGGMVPLWRGASGKPLRQAPAGEHVTIVEGIEDGLVAALARPERRVLCALASYNLGNLTLPATVTDVTLAIDDDGDNASTAKAVAAAVAAYQRQGRRVWIARPPAGAKDLNAAIMGAA